MKDEIKFLCTLLFLLSRSKITYDAYISSGKLFLYAKILKESNDLIKELLIQNAYLLPASQIENILALLHHIDVWSSIWEESFVSFQPKINSIFYFDNSVKFPRLEISNLNNYYELLINKS